MVAALVRQRRRLLLATVAVTLAVGYLAGALTLLDRVSQGLDRLAAAGAERADLIVEGEVAYESALEQTRRLVPSSIAPSIAGIPGIAAVSPRVEDIAILLDPEDEPVVPLGLSEQPLGTNWPDDPEMSPFTFVGDGQAPTGPDEVVIDERSARIAGVGVGDEIGVVGKSVPRSYEVVGIVTTEQGELPEGSSLALFSTDQARLLFESPDNDNRVAIRLEPGADVAEVEAAVRAVLPAGAEVVDGATGARHRQESINRSFTLVRVLITGFALLALVVGMVTVANSLTLLYAERRRTFAGLRLVGAHQHQLLTAAMIEAAALAAVASLLGAPLGLVLGRLIEGAIGALGTSIPVGGSVVSVPALLTAMVIGTIATVLAAIVPAVRACRVAPIEAVSDSPAASALPWSVRIVNGALVGVGAVALLSGMMLLGDVTAPVAIGVAVAVVAVAAAFALLPTVLSLAVAAGIRCIPTRPAALSRIGARDAVRNRARTAATTGALLLATAVVAGLAVFLASFARSIDGDVGRLVQSDLVVDSGTFTRGGLPGELLVELRSLPEVAAVSGWQVGRVNAGVLPLRITGVDGSSIAEVIDPGWTTGSSESLDREGVALSQGTAEALGAVIGDTVPITFTSGGVENLRVEGIYTQGSLLLGEAMIDRSTLLAQVPASTDIAALVRLSFDGPTSVAAVEELASEFGVDSVLRPDAFVDSRSELLTGFQRVIQWMLLFTLLQALVGVVNTLLLSVGERRREFGLLRATGASRRQLLRLVLMEGLSFAAVGTALGLLVGVGGAVLSVRALARFGISSVDIPVGVLLVTAVAAMVLGVAAALVPARWAAAVPPLEAVADAGGDRGSRLRSRIPARSLARAGARGPVALGGESGRRPLWRPPALATEPVPVPPPFRGTAPPPPASTVSPPPSPIAPPPSPVVSALPAPAPPPIAPAPAPPPAPSPIAARASGATPPSAPDRQAPRSDQRSDQRPAAGTGQVPGPFSPDPGQRADAPRRGGPAADGWVRPRADTGRPFGHSSDPMRGDTPALFGPTPRTDPRSVRRQEAAAEPLSDAVRIRLGAALERLDRATQDDAHAVLSAFARSLEPDEQIGHLAQGWTKGLTCLVARTDRGIVIVIDRFPEPVVERLDRRRAAISVYGPPGTERVSLAVVDGRRLLEVTGVRDRSEAAGLVNPTARSASVPEYF